MDYGKLEEGSGLSHYAFSYSVFYNWFCGWYVV